MAGPRKRRVPPEPSFMRRVQQKASNKINEVSESYLSNLTNYRWMRYVIAIWAVRMLFVLIGLLFPLFSLFSTAPLEKYEFALQTEQWSRSNISFLRKLVDEDTPFLFSNAPIPSGLASILLGSMPDHLRNVKKIPSGQFMYYSSEQSWSNAIPKILNHSHINISTEHFIRCLLSSSDCDYSSKLYLSHVLHSPQQNPLILSSAPYMLDIPSASKGMSPEFRLWMSSSDVRVSPHYDMEHNFFLQLNGTKTFLVASPAYIRLFRPFSYLHPHWRQSPLTELMNITSILNHVVGSSPSCAKFENGSSQMMKSVKHSESISSLRWGVDCQQQFVIMPQMDRRKKRKPSSDSILSDDGEVKKVIEEGSFFEVTLKPGDMLYIPPFYFHAVRAHSYSVSMNVWTGSKYLAVVDSLKKNDLPFRSNADTVAQFSALAAMVKMIWQDLHGQIDMTYFASLMKDRHSSSQNNHECLGKEVCFDDNETRTPELPRCTLKSLRRAEQDKVVRRVAKGVGSLIKGFPLSIQVSMVMDYVDEVFDFVAGANSNPAEIQHFVDACIDVQKYF